MFVFHFVNFVGNLDIQVPRNHGIPPDSPILIFYKEKGDLSKHEILRRFNKILSDYNISYLRPVKSLTGEWLLDLQEFRYSFECLSKSQHLKGKITLEPDYTQERTVDEYSDEIIHEFTRIKFSIYPEDLKISSLTSFSDLPDELKEPLNRFRKDFGTKDKCGFLMMKFEDTKIQTGIVQIIKSHFESKGLNLLRADDKWYADDLFTNIKTYMHGCSFGVALFERINSNYFNPNVSLEIGYMMAMNKPILFLKDRTLTSLHSDLVGKLYHEYDFQNPQNTLPTVIDRWINDKDI